MKPITVGAGKAIPGTWPGVMAKVEESVWTGPYAGRDALSFTFEIACQDGPATFVEKTGTSLDMGPTHSNLRRVVEGLLGRPVQRHESIDPESFIGTPVLLTLAPKGRGTKLESLERRH